MGHPLMDFARRVERRAAARRMEKALNTALSDKHLADDVGLPHQPDPSRKLKLW